MTDDIRQEAVARVHKDGSHRIRPLADETIDAVIDASGLIEQLNEAIAQRDEARKQSEGAGAKEVLKAVERRVLARLEELEQQLAAERALCDRLRAIHVPYEVEVEVWHDNEPCYEALSYCCPGHFRTMQCCANCGADDDGEMVRYLEWPCESVRLIDDHRAAERSEERSNYVEVHHPSGGITEVRRARAAEHSEAEGP